LRSYHNVPKFKGTLARAGVLGALNNGKKVGIGAELLDKMEQEPHKNRPPPQNKFYYSGFRGDNYTAEKEQNLLNSERF
jgi:hypothetical protein